MKNRELNFGYFNLEYNLIYEKEVDKEFVYLDDEKHVVGKVFGQQLNESMMQFLTYLVLLEDSYLSFDWDLKSGDENINVYFENPKRLIQVYELMDDQSKSDFVKVVTDATLKVFEFDQNKGRMVRYGMAKIKKFLDEYFGVDISYEEIEGFDFGKILKK